MIEIAVYVIASLFWIGGLAAFGLFCIGLHWVMGKFE